MLAIRLQRTGRKGNAQYRVIVQEAQRTPTSGRVVHRLGNYDPHAKTFAIDKEKAEFYLGHGAQPSDRVARLFKNNGVKLPDWVKISEPIKRTVRNPEKLRKNQPKVEKPADEPVEPTTESEAPASEEVAETKVASAEQTEVVAEDPEEAEAKTKEPVEATATEEDVKTETTTDDEEAPKDQDKSAESGTKA